LSGLLFVDILEISDVVKSKFYEMKNFFVDVGRDLLI